MPNQPRLIDHPSSDHDPEAAARREAYRERLRAYLQDPDFRAIEGFPIGEDEDILALSDPPYYTACPNPFLPEILEEWQVERAALRAELGLPDDEDYRREPFATDVSEGKNDPIYNAHSYHTKVPHKAIMRYILHYTQPGDVVFDGFCGTGMTGVAAQLCADRKVVQELGYRVDEEGVIYEGEEAISQLGARRAVLVDLSPAATFIAYNYNTPVDVDAFKREAQHILDEVEEECGWMYETWHPHCEDPNRVKGKVIYVVWSDIFICPECSNEINYWNVTVVDQANGEVLRRFPCPECGKTHSKRTLDYAFETIYDRTLGNTIRRVKQIPVVISYRVGSKRYEKEPDIEDLTALKKIRGQDNPYWFPTDRMPEGDESRRNDDIGITHVYQYYTQRNFWILSAVFTKINNRGYSDRLRGMLWFWFTSSHSRLHRMNRYMARHSRHVGPLSGTLYVSSTTAEISPFYFMEAKLKHHSQLSSPPTGSAIQAQSLTNLEELMKGSDCWADYIFTDPPFGGNLMYSELSFLWEAWFRVFTNNESEAIVNETQRKGLTEYQGLMEKSFEGYYHALKPGHWMTIEFHNSQNRVWNIIQESILRAGFVVADVRTLDKKKGTTKQLTLASAVKQDLIISAYKPRAGFEARFAQEAGTPEGAWAFVRQHLAQLPVVVAAEGQLETLAERQDYLLFDRMVAFHIQRGATVPLSAPEFYAGLRQRFIERDTMFFLPEQVAAYDRARLEAESVAQLALFVADEKSAIQWLRQQLEPQAGGQPQTYQELQPQFLQQLHQARHEELPELRDLLEQNFLQDEADRWYAPDPNKASDLEQLRRRALLREFRGYVEGAGRLRKFRTEAVRAGFADAWQRQDYAIIVQVAERLDESVLQEDPELLMYYDNAGLRVGM